MKLLNEKNTRTPNALKTCRFCRSSFDPKERKPKNGRWEPAYCDKVCRQRWHTWKYLESKRAK